MERPLRQIPLTRIITKQATTTDGSSCCHLSYLLRPCVCAHDRQKAVMAVALSIWLVPGESVDAEVSVIKVEQDDWMEEVLDDGGVGMLNVQFDHMFADDSD